MFVLSPYAQAFYLAFTDWNGVSGQANLVGLDNFGRLWSDPLFLAALRNNGLMLLVVPLVTIALALFLASWSRRRAPRAAIRGASLYRVVYFFPQLLSRRDHRGALAVRVHAPTAGCSTALLRGGRAWTAWPRSWLAEPDLALWCGDGGADLVGGRLLRGAVLGRDGVDPARHHRGGAIDGAGRLTMFRRITLPLIWDSVQVALDLPRHRSRWTGSPWCRS